jgi:hypothetical protein
MLYFLCRVGGQIDLRANPLESAAAASRSIAINQVKRPGFHILLISSTVAVRVTGRRLHRKRVKDSWQ